MKSHQSPAPWHGGPLRRRDRPMPRSRGASDQPRYACGTRATPRSAREGNLNPGEEAVYKGEGTANPDEGQFERLIVLERHRDLFRRHTRTEIRAFVRRPSGRAGPTWRRSPRYPAPTCSSLRCRRAVDPARGCRQHAVGRGPRMPPPSSRATGRDRGRRHRTTISMLEGRASVSPAPTASTMTSRAATR